MPMLLTVQKPATAQKVVIVNGSAEMLELFDTAFEAGHYDVVFVESTDRAYSRIKQVQPDLVILCLHLDDIDSFQVLSMLKLDDETRDIPVLTCTSETEGVQLEDESGEASESALMSAKAAARMN